jgi:hypothetical protein
LSTNPYDAPQASLEGTSTETAPPLWNPNAAACWSFFFTPVFGALLLTMNWRALGEKEKASASRIWVIASMVLMLLTVVVPFVGSDSVGVRLFTRFIGFALLISWYVASVRGQVQYVSEHFGDAYPRRGWIVPILCAIAALVALVFVASLFDTGEFRSMDGPVSSN